MSDSTLRSFTAHDGSNIAVMEWPLPAETPSRGMVLIVHGLGEHAGRYDHVGERLNSWGFAVRSYDQYGHGESDGKPGALPSDGFLLENLAELIDTTRRHLEPRLPLILMGHSLGGLVAARLVSMNLRPVDALVLSSPALDAGMNAFQKLLVAVLPRLAPDLRVGNGLNANYLSHDAQVVADYQADPRCHDRISARLARFIATAGPATVAAAPTWAVPTLLMWAGADRLVSPAGSQAFAQAAPPAVVQSHCFENAFHELFNETPEYATPVFDTLRERRRHRKDRAEDRRIGEAALVQTRTPQDFLRDAQEPPRTGPGRVLGLTTPLPSQGLPALRRLTALVEEAYYSSRICSDAMVQESERLAAGLLPTTTAGKSRSWWPPRSGSGARSSTSCAAATSCPAAAGRWLARSAPCSPTSSAGSAATSPTSRSRRRWA